MPLAGFQLKVFSFPFLSCRDLIPYSYYTRLDEFSAKIAHTYRQIQCCIEEFHMATILTSIINLIIYQINFFQSLHRILVCRDAPKVRFTRLQFSCSKTSISSGVFSPLTGLRSYQIASESILQAIIFTSQIASSNLMA